MSEEKIIYRIHECPSDEYPYNVQEIKIIDSGFKVIYDPKKEGAV